MPSSSKHIVANERKPSLEIKNFPLGSFPFLAIINNTAIDMGGKSYTYTSKLLERGLMKHIAVLVLIFRGTLHFSHVSVNVFIDL